MLGPLHILVKSRDHEIVRTQNKLSKGRRKTPPNLLVWSRALKCSAKSYVTGPLTKCYFNECLFMWVLTHDKLDSCEHSENRSAMLSWFCVKLTSKRWFLEIVQVTTKHDPFDAM